ncbi:aldo/keto reductase [Candidatus Formimonas warabiya]|uniref:aldo/keto reductase n=1 Tax=Formimonas warabiya TaxID=1761012 RepID=UPI001BE3EB9A|nr:aldo/keto reductase [Candidatus Formimonas warabiya]
MQYRKLGKTGFEVSEIGFGAWGIGGGWWKGADDEAAIQSLNLAIDQGVNFIDTALGYENSENLVGKVIRSRPEKIYVSSKVPPKNYVFPAVLGSDIQEAYPKEWIIACTEKSLKQLGLECLDVQLMHVYVNSWAESDEWREAARLLKEQGKIKAFGASINFPYNSQDDGISAMESGDFEVCEVVYNIFQQEPNQDILPAAQKHHVGIIARCPLDEGALTGKIGPDTVFPEGSFLETYFKDERKKVAYEKCQALKWLVDEGYAGSIAEGALRFCLSHEAVSTVIVGMRNPKWVPVNTAVSDQGPLPKEAIERLKMHAFDHNWWL